MKTLAPVIDLTLVKLNKKRREASRSGNVVEEHALRILIDGYDEGLWDVWWDKGEPIFAARGSDPEAIREFIDKKD